MRPDRNIRILGDYKLNANIPSKLEKYPMPMIEELFTKHLVGHAFSSFRCLTKLVLAEESCKVARINTDKGLFQYTCPLFSVSSA